MKKETYLAFDLGAESGRAVLGTLAGGRVEIREIHRFPNGPVAVGESLHWDVPGLFGELRHGLKIAAEAGPRLAGMAVDTWGVDFGLVDERGALIGLPRSYRDPRNAAARDDFLSGFGKSRLYALTGIQFLPFNSLFQLHALRLAHDPALEAARRLLFMPDLFTFLLSGSMATDETIASTSQLLDPRRMAWSEELIAALGLRSELLNRPLRPGTVVGRLLPEMAAGSGLDEIPVIATAGHDTASAVAAVPAEGEDWAYISSGTWSLVGLELPSPLITPEAERLNFTNEVGLEGRVRFLKNVTGLWLVAQCRRAWNADGPASYEDLMAAAAAAPPFAAFVDPDDPAFLHPADMPESIREFCRRSGQSVPETRGAVVRCALESLALKYRLVLEELGRLAPRPIRRVHVIGGGSRNELLCRFTADAAAIPVVAGPAEATALGNVLGQALALGRVRSLEDIRTIAAASAAPSVYRPENPSAWDEAYARFKPVVEDSRRAHE
ncbi:MAG: rhamnulokinase [Candidatus Aminicenantes bacterium]|nr:rhamnulokinase [Candidatus Aminicenantes bacterium]